LDVELPRLVSSTRVERTSAFLDARRGNVLPGRASSRKSFRLRASRTNVPDLLPPTRVRDTPPQADLDDSKTISYDEFKHLMKQS